MTVHRITEETKKIISQIPATMPMPENVIDVLMPQNMTVNTLLIDIQNDLGLDIANQFVELVIENKISEDPKQLLEYLFQRRAHPVARMALRRINSALECLDCSKENNWKPTK